jgi:hypothetical protein
MLSAGITCDQIILSARITCDQIAKAGLEFFHTEVPESGSAVGLTRRRDK